MSRFLATMLALSLGACTTAPTLPPLPERPAEELEPLWQQHLKEIGKLTGWSLEGRIVVNTNDDGWNGELRWSQSPRDYQIHFTAPFGQGAFKLEGDSDGVEMRLSDGQVYRAPDAESLLMDHVGWYLPLEEFRFWVTGVPDTPDNGRKILNNSGQLAGFSQDQWQVSYPEYFAVGDVMMPRKVYFKNHALSVRLVIDRWVLKSGGNTRQQSYRENS